MSEVPKSGRPRLNALLSAFVVCAGGLALYFALSPHEQCVRSKSAHLKRVVYKLVPDRADYAARVFCSEAREPGR